jgi:hypothetical protein
MFIIILLGVKFGGKEKNKLNQDIPIHSSEEGNKNKNLILNQKEEYISDNNDENQFVIFNMFKNMLNKNKFPKDGRATNSDNKLKKYSMSDFKQSHIVKEEGEHAHTDYNLENDNPFSQEQISIIKEINYLPHNVIEINYDYCKNKEDTFGFIQKEYDDENKVINNNNTNAINSFLSEEENININISPPQIEKNINPSLNLQQDKITTDNKIISPTPLQPSDNSKFYKKKYESFKKKYNEMRKKYNKEKKITEMLNLKLFYETHKSISITNERLNSTKMTTNCDINNNQNNTNDEKFTKLLYEKLQENVILFEKLENEILHKDSLISEKNEVITHQKNTIDKLLEQFDFFLKQGNYLINDLILIKQNMHDKNFQEVTKEFDEISIKINEYSNKVKDFSYKTTNIDSEGIKCRIDCDYNNVNENENNSVINFTISNTNSNVPNKTKDEFLAAYLSKNEKDKDRSLRLLDLTNIQGCVDNLITSQFSNNNNKNINLSLERHSHSLHENKPCDREIEEILYN